MHSILWWISAGRSTDAGVRVHIAGGRVSGCMRGGCGVICFWSRGDAEKGRGGRNHGDAVSREGAMLRNRCPRGRSRTDSREIWGRGGAEVCSGFRAAGAMIDEYYSVFCSVLGGSGGCTLSICIS